MILFDRVSDLTRRVIVMNGYFREIFLAFRREPGICFHDLSFVNQPNKFTPKMHRATKSTPSTIGHDSRTRTSATSAIPN
jgi:hypothetical protein